MVVPLEPLKRYECSYDDCYHSFDTEREVKAHLKDKDIHPFYCGKTPKQEQLERGFPICNFHGRSWEDLLDHKVQDMMQWLVGDRKKETPKKFNHIVCEFCSKDFGSLSGREAHRKQNHTADQHIACKGYMHVRDSEGNLTREECGMVFGRPSQLMHHIESGFCAYIRPKALEDERQQKQVVKQILRDPEGFQKLEISAPDEDKDDVSAGGVDLMSMDDCGQSIGAAPLTPTLTRASVSDMSTNRMTFQPAQPKLNTEWPGLPPSSSVALNAAMSNLSFNSRSAGLKSPRSDTRGQETASVVSDTASTDLDSNSITSRSATMGVWVNKNPSDRLFGRIKPTPVLQKNWDAISAAHERSKLEDEKTNMFYARFWDPLDPDYNPNLFRIPDKEDKNVPPYLCPFSQCLRRFRAPEDIGNHLRDNHAIQSKTCPMCHKLFESLTRFVQHCESSSRGGKCKIAQHPGYATFLFEITGGLLSATKNPEEPVEGHTIEERHGKRRELSPYEQAQVERGLKDYDYEAMAPTRPAVHKW